MTYKEHGAPVDERVRDLLGRMTLEEKAAQLSAVLPHMLIEKGAVSEARLTEFLSRGLGRIPQFPMPFIASATQVAEAFNAIQRFAIEETRLGIPVMAQVECLNGVVAVDAASFPAPIAMASTWSPELTERAAWVIGRQMRAMTSGSNALAPVVDLARDPRWGRVAETYGECAYLNSAFGVAFVRGLQQDGDLTAGVQACAKHFLGYSVTQGGLNSAEISVGERELYEAYARPFEAMIQGAGLRAIMCTYSAIDGVPVSFSPKILRGLLRDKMGFTGSAICDGGSIERACLVQHAAADLREAAMLALEAGLDADAPVTRAFHHLPEAVRSGDLDEHFLDEACSRVLRQKFELGLFDDPYVDAAKTHEAFGRPEDEALSLELCEKSVTLLKNEANLLPLSPTTGTVAVIGPHGNNITALFGGYTFPSTLQTLAAAARGRGAFSMAGVNDAVEETGGFQGLFNVDTPEDLAAEDFVERYCAAKYGVKPIVDEISARLTDGQVLYARGCNIDDDDRSGFDEAVAIARQADVVIMTIGGRSGWTDATSGEGQDRTSIDLPGVQEELLKVVHAVGPPVVLVLFNGRPLAINWASEHVDAILEVWFTGPHGGEAISKVLFGESNPGGRLPVSIPRSSGQVPIYYNHKNGSGYVRDIDPTTVDALFGGGYTDVPSTPLYPFGYGLSYTTFEYSDPVLESGKVDSRGQLRISCTLTNSGDREGDEVVQLYCRDLQARVTRPVKELVGFQRVTLRPGERKRVRFTVQMDQLAFYDEEMNFVVEPGTMEAMIGRSSSHIEFHEEFEIAGEKLLVGVPRSYLSTCEVTPAQ